MFVLGGHGARQDDVDGAIGCAKGSLEEPFDQLPWQNLGTLGTEGTIAEDTAKYAPEGVGVVTV